VERLGHFPELGIDREVTEPHTRQLVGGSAGKPSPALPQCGGTSGLTVAYNHHDTAEARRRTTRRLALADTGVARGRIDAEKAIQLAEATERRAMAEAEPRQRRAATSPARGATFQVPLRHQL
jgi:hypothetical protein